MSVLSGGRRLVLVAVAVASLVAAAAGCSLSSTPLDAEHQAFAGEWKAPDGTTVHIWSNGRGDYKSGGTSVTGAPVAFAGDKMTIKLMGLGKEFTVTAPPTVKGGKKVLVLDGIEFTHQE